jgi:SAM-dependent methyltransferase
MKATTLESLVCPFCASSLDLAAGAAEDELGISFGVTVCCGCTYEFPIVGGVLVVAEPGQLIGVEAEAPSFGLGRGVAARTLCRLIRSGQHPEAFSRLLNPAAPDADLLAAPAGRDAAAHTEGPAGPVLPDPHREPRIPTGVQARLNRITGGRLLVRARRRLAEYLLANRETLTALEAIDLYMGRYSRAETAVHFAFAFGQPRHLAALSVASVIKDRGGPILDLACGPGHLTHFFCAGEEDRVVVGVDRNFFRLWVARNFTAPGADFVCQWIDRPLPFSSGMFDSAFCSDAFHLVLNKSGLVREAARLIAPDGLLGIVRFGNAAIEPREGHELTVDGYSRLFEGMPHRLAGEGELVAAYLRREKLDLSPRPASGDLAEQKWLSAVLSPDSATLGKYEAAQEWSHGEGRLVLNPVYRATGRDAAGGLKLSFQFPSKWYEFENSGYLEYAPAEVEVSAAGLDALRSGERNAEVRELIERFVVLGVPDRYTPIWW